jgi:DNA polymerase phi
MGNLDVVDWKNKHTHWPPFVRIVIDGGAAMTSSLQHFWHLASSSTKDRLRSAHELINSLDLTQDGERGADVVPGPSRIFDDGLVGDVRDDELQQAEEALQQCGSTELAYTLKRLIKGLASHRDSARLGFSVTLCELLSHISTISTYHVTTLILFYSIPNGKMKGQEERDMFFARLFGLYALVRSEMLSRDEVSAEADAKRVISILWSMANRKSWLTESVAKTTMEYIHIVSMSSLSWKGSFSRWLLERICEEKSITVDHVAVFMAVQKWLPEAFTSKSQRLPHFASQEVLTLPNLPLLARLVKDARIQEGQADASTEINATSSAGSMQPHFVWDLMLSAYLNANEKKKVSFEELFRHLVDDNLFSATSSHQKKAWGFQIWTKAVEILPETLLPFAFTQNLMRTLMNQLGGKDRMLHKIALKACLDIQQSVKGRPEIAPVVVKQLIGPLGSVKFDQMTKTKTVENILRFFDQKQTRAHVDELIRLFVCAETNGTRISLLDQLLVIARNDAIRTDDACKENILTLFAAHGLYIVKKAISDADANRSCLEHAPAVPFAPTVATICRSHFLSCLSDLQAGQSGNESAVDWVLRAEDLMLWLDSKEKVFEKRAKKSLGCVELARKTVKSLRTEKQPARQGVGKDAKRALTSLLSMSVFYIVVQQVVEEEAKMLLEPMVDCINRLVQPQEDPVDDEQPGAMELLIDCISNALQPTSAFLRGVATDAFNAHAELMTRSSMRLMLEQLGFNQGEGEQPDDESDMLGKDGEEMQVESESDTSATSSQSSDVDEDEDMDDDGVDADFAAKVRHALMSGTRIANEDDEDISSGEEDAENRSDADDEEMLLIDDKLAEVFREKFSTRKKEDEAKKEEINFHVRIIDLLDHFARRKPDSPLCVDMVLPLFTIALEKDKALESLRQRASKVLHKTLSRVKDSPSDVQMAEVASSLDAIQKMAATGLTANQQSLASAANIYLTRSVLQNKEEIPQLIRQTYLSSLQDFMERKSNNLKPSFLIDAVQRFPRLGFTLRHELLQYGFRPATNAQSVFRQAQALEMLRTSLAQVVAQRSLYGDVDVLNMNKTLQEVAHQILQSVQADAQKTKDLLKLALQFARLSKRWLEKDGGGAGSIALDEIWRQTEVDKAMDKVTQGGGGSQINLMKQLTMLTRANDSATMTKAKRTAEATDAVDTHNKKKSRVKK